MQAQMKPEMKEEARRFQELIREPDSNPFKSSNQYDREH